MSELSEDSSSSQPAVRRWLWWVGGMAVMLVVVAVMWPGTAWWVEHVDGVDLNAKDPQTGKPLLEAKDRQEVLDKARGRLTAVATGFLAAFAIYYTAANARSARQTAQAARESVAAALRSADLNEQAQRRTHELTERGQLNDRFTAAVAQLEGSPAVQLGGVHTLAGIADDAPDMRQTCIDVLCAFLRLPYDPNPGEDGDPEARKAYRAFREVRHTVIRLIGNHLRLPAEHPRSWQGHDFDFTDVVFDGGDFNQAHFSSGIVDFRNAYFTGGRVDFMGAYFTGGRVDFGEAEFAGGTVGFRDVDFTGGFVNFGNAGFTGGFVNFRNAGFLGGTVDFTYTGFLGGTVDFRGAQFAEGTANFQFAEFAGGTVDFGNAEFADGTVNFGNARFAGGTVDFSKARGDRSPSLATEGLHGVLLPPSWTLPQGQEEGL